MGNLWGLVSKQVEVITKAGDVYEGILGDIAGSYIHLLLQNDSGVWLNKDSIKQCKEEVTHGHD